MASFDHSHIGDEFSSAREDSEVRHRWTGETLVATVVAADAALVFGSALAAQVAYETLIAVDTGDSFASLGVLATALFLGFMALTGGYRTARLREARFQTLRVAQAWGFVFFTLAWIAFLMKATDHFSRGVISFWFGFGGVGLLAAHWAGARTLARACRRGLVAHGRVAVVAIAGEAGAARITRQLGDAGIEVAALSRIPPESEEAGEAQAVALPVAEVVQAALAKGRVDGIYVFGSWRERRRIGELKAALAPLPLPIHLFADHEMERMLRRPKLQVGDLIGLELGRAPLTRTDRAMKRLLDLMVAGFGLALLSPVMALTAAAIVAESGFPILFRQHRKGFGARPFAILKFRSMTVRENGPDVVQASRGDARITRIGRMIRRTSIDELPQLFNVLKGDMSIVGPRPHAIAHDDHYDGLIATYAMRQHVKPGITGWAQINGLRGETRNVEQMRARVEHDLWYIDNWSIWLDLRIIVVTALKVFFDENAY
ncbi:MAG: undecaprenyl-phosphate glucose phosphotransferase [Hyphomicrobiales bacterium]|nr:undecaprenyl-phosphate glucose phosphotransferase [Hyphomicrobiales bacterium]